MRIGEVALGIPTLYGVYELVEIIKNEGLTTYKSIIILAFMLGTGLMTWGKDMQLTNVVTAETIINLEEDELSRKKTL